MAAAAIRATRSRITDVASARQWAASTPLSGVLRGAQLTYYGGAFNPPTNAHSHIAMQAAARCDLLWLDPDPASAHKPRFMDESLAARVSMCERLLSDYPLHTQKMGVGCLRRDMGPVAGSGPELFRVLRALVGPDGRIVWTLGADVATGMKYWREKVAECTQPGDTCDELLVFRRAGSDEAEARQVLRGLRCAVTWRPLVQSALMPCTPYGPAKWPRTAQGSPSHPKAPPPRTLPSPRRWLDMPEELLGASSQRARKALVSAAAGGRREGDGRDMCSALMPGSVAAFCLTQPELIAMYQRQLRALDGSEG